MDACEGSDQLLRSNAKQVKHVGRIIAGYLRILRHTSDFKAGRNCDEEQILAGNTDGLA